MEAPIEEPKHLRTLRRLVNTLTIVLILGFITVVVVIVIRFGAPATVSLGPKLPAHIDLPGSETPQAVTFGTNWTAVVTIDDWGHERIRLYKPDGTPGQTLEIEHYE